MKKLAITPPFGFKFSETSKLICTKKKDVLVFCLAMTDNPDLIRAIALDTHRGRLKFLRDNGFGVYYL